jgi:hypothetical protein
MKRTTLQIEPAIYAELRRRAADQGRTLTEVVESALRLGLERKAGRRKRPNLPSYDLGPFLVEPSQRPNEDGRSDQPRGGRKG